MWIKLFIKALVDPNIVGPNANFGQHCTNPLCTVDLGGLFFNKKSPSTNKNNHSSEEILPPFYFKVAFIARTSIYI